MKIVTFSIHGNKIEIKELLKYFRVNKKVQQKHKPNDRYTLVET